MEVSVEAPGLDGSQVEFSMERLDGKSWGTIGTARGTVSKGKARARMPVEHPAGGESAGSLARRRLRFRASLLGGEPVRVRAELTPDLDAKKLRFRAEVVQDVGAQKLRFRAEPVPDLRPRKLRFRTEVPVPEHPALTRLRVELKGGTADDHVQTNSSG